MAADYDTLVYTEVGGSKLVVADGGEIEIQSGGTLDVLSGATFNFGTFGASMVVNQTDNYPVGVFGNITVAQTTGSTTQRAIWARMDVDANLSGTASVTGAELQFRFDGATSIGSGVEAEQYTGAWLYFEQDTSGDTLADYCHASAAFASVETHSDLSLSANTHLSGIEIASRLGASDGVAWADTTGTTAGLFITKAPAATGVTASAWPYGIVIEHATVGINVTDVDRVLLGGGYSTADNLPMTTDNHYLVGIFGKMATTEDITLEQRVILGRLGVVAGVTIGSAAGWGQGMSGVKGHIAFYGGSDTETYCWHNAGVYGHIQADGVATVNFKDGSHTACFYGHAGLVAASSARTYVDTGAVIAGIALHSGIGASINNSGTIAGVYIYKDTAGNLDWPIGVDINNCTTGMDIGACTTGITFTGAQTTAVDISATGLTDGILIDGATPVDGIHISSNCTGAALNITGVTSDAGILVGANGTELIRISDSHYSVGIFSKINADEDTTRTLRGLWSRFAVPANIQVGSNAGWGEGIDAIEGNVKLYGGSTGTYTQIYCWQIAGVWAMLETDDTDHIHFESGSHAAGLFAHIELGSGVELQAGSASAAVVAFSNSHASADIAAGDYVGVLVDKESAKLSFQAGLKIEDASSTTGIDIGTCTTAGINIVTGQVTGINIAGTCSTAGISMGGLDTGDQAMVVTWTGASSESTAAGAGICSLTLTSNNNAGSDNDMLIGYHVSIATSTQDQANNILVGTDSIVTVSKNIDSCAAGRFTVVLNDATGEVDDGASAVYAVATATATSTIGAGPFTAVWAQYDGAAAITTSAGDTSCFFGDIDESVDVGLSLDVASTKIATVGIELGGAGTYTTGINLPACTTAGINIAGGTAAGAALLIGDDTTGVKVDGTPAYASRMYADVITGSYTNIGCLRTMTTIASDAVITSNSFTTASYNRLEMDGGATLSGWVVSVLGYLKNTTGTVSASAAIVAPIVGLINLGSGYTDPAGWTAAFIAGTYGNAGAITDFTGYLVMDQAQDNFDNGFMCADNAATTGLKVGICTTGIALTGAMNDGILISGAMVDNGIEVTGVCGGSAFLATTTTATASIIDLYVNSTYTNDTIYEWHTAGRFDMTYTPAGGTGSSMGSALVGICDIDATTVLNGPAYFQGVSGRLYITAASELDYGSGKCSALHGELLARSGATMSGGHIAVLDLVCNTQVDFAGMDINTYIFFDNDAGHALGGLESVMHLRVWDTDYLLDLPSAANPGMLSVTGAGGLTRYGRIKVRVDGTDCYLSLFTD